MKDRVVIGDCTLIRGDALEALRAMSAASVDCVVTDPPYPCIKRDYGYWTEAEWFALINPVVEECRRVLTPTGSAVFILQPNSERVGRMRTWLWRFMADWGERWGIVQDAYWWNYTAIPEAHAIQAKLMRPSVKACVWLGPADSWRDQTAVLWEPSAHTARQALCSADRFRDPDASGHGMNRTAASEVAIRNGGSTPYNLLPVANSRGHTTAGAHGHGAGTPLTLARWWVRYLCPPGGAVLDPFVGSGTTLLAAAKECRGGIGVERKPEYFAIAERRLRECVGGGLYAGVAS